MTVEERKDLLIIALKLNQIEIDPNILKIVINTIDLIDSTEGKCDIKQILKIKNL